MSALPAFAGLTREGRSRSRRGCWGWGGGWSANHPEPRQAAHSQIRPPPPAHALPFKAAGLRGRRAAQRTRVQRTPAPQTHAGSPSARRSRRPAGEVATASKKESRLGLSPLPRRGTMARLAALWHSAPLVSIFGSTWFLLFVARQVGQSERPASLPLLALFWSVLRRGALELGARSLQRGAVPRLRCHRSWDRWREVGAEAAPRGELWAGGVKSAPSLSPASRGPVPASRPRPGPASSWAESGGRRRQRRVRLSPREPRTPRDGPRRTPSLLRRRGSGAGTLLLSSFP